MDTSTSASGSIAAIVLAAGASTRLGAGRSKQLLRYQGRTLLRHSVEQALASSCRPVIVVLGAEVERCRRELDGLDVHVAINPEWAEGMGSSIRAGMAAMTAAAADARAVVITLCDQPLVGAAFIDRLVRRYAAEAAATSEQAVLESAAREIAGQESGGREAADRRATDLEAADRAPTVAAEYDGRPGVPALFPRSRFAELSRLDGAAGARRLLRPARAQAVAQHVAQGVVQDMAHDMAHDMARDVVITLPCPEAAVDVDTITDYEALPQ